MSEQPPQTPPEDESKSRREDQSFQPRPLWRLYGVVMLGLWMVTVLMAVLTETDYLFRAPPDTFLRPASATIREGLETDTSVIVDQVVVTSWQSEGDTLDAAFLNIEQVPYQYAVRGSYADIDDVIGRQLAADVVYGQVITSNLLEEAPPTPDIYATIIAAPVGVTPVPQQSVDVFVPRYAIPAGSQITASDLYLQQLPPEYVPSNAVYFEEQIIDQFAAIDLPAGYPIGLEYVQPPEELVAVPEFDTTVCTMQFSHSLPLYADPIIPRMIGETRPNTTFLVTARAGDNYRLALPSGYELGWVISVSAAMISNPC